MNRIMPPIAMTQTTPAATAQNGLQRAAQNATGLGNGLNAANPVGQNTKAAPDFTSLLGNMLTEVSQAQAQSSDMNRRLQMGDPKATIEDTVLAMNTASVQFQMVVQVRSKLVQSYTDIMNMPV
jgi:flagellar hook-basal body complex protein FliE